MNAVASSRPFLPHGFLMTGAAGALSLALAGLAPKELAIVLLILGGALLLALTVRWPLEAIITVYPFTWQIMALQIPLPFTEFGMSAERLFAIIVAPGLLLGLATGKVRYVPIPIPILGGLGTLLLVYLASALVHGGGLGALLQLVLKAGLAFMAFIAVSDETMARRMMRMLLLGFAVASLAVLSLAIIGEDLDALFLTRGTRQIIVIDSFFKAGWVNAARVAHLAEFGVWLALVEAALARTRLRRASWGLLAVALLASQMLIFRRMVILSAVLALLFLTVYRRTRVRALAATVLVSASLLFGTLILPGSSFWQYRLEETLQEIPRGADPREQLLIASWEMWSDAPLFGHGLNRFETAALRYQGLLSAWENPWVPIAPHNSFAMIAVELGAVGFLALLFFLGAVTRELWAADRGRAPGYPGQLMAMWPVLFGQVMVWWSLASALYLNLSWFLFGAMVGMARVARSAASTFTEKK